MLREFKSFLWSWKYPLLFVGFFLIVLTQRFLNEKQRGLMNSVTSDGLGYYCYLPAAVIYHDFSYSFYDKPENKINPFYRPSLNEHNGRGVNKYYCGTSICLLPFFLFGILISLIAGTDINGYTDTFLMLVSIASIIYYLLSVFLISKVAKFFNISEKVSLGASLVFFFGTNLFHYTIQEPSMSHVYSFFAVSLFLFSFVRLINNTSIKNLAFLGLSLALVVLIRPVNLVVIFFTPFFFANFKEYLSFIKSLFICHLKGLIYFIFAVVFVSSIQLIFYYFQTGDFFVFSYEGETFNFAKPEFINVLFSYKKGLIFYVPILFLVIIVFLFTKAYWYKKIVFGITFIIFLYITSSWWCWWYGEGLSIRPIVDILPLFVIVSVLMYNKLSVIKRKILVFVTLPFLFMSQLTAYQYSNFLLSRDDMNEEKYWDAFLKTDLIEVLNKKEKRILMGSPIVKEVILDYEYSENDSRIVDGGYYSAKSCIVGEGNYYSKGFCIAKNDINLDDTFYLLVECMIKPSEEGKNVALVVSISEKERVKTWNVVFSSFFEKNEDGWLKMKNIVEVDKYIFTDGSDIKIFVNSERGNNLVDNLKYSIVKK